MSSDQVCLSFVGANHIPSTKECRVSFQTPSWHLGSIEEFLLPQPARNRAQGVLCTPGFQAFVPKALEGGGQMQMCHPGRDDNPSLLPVTPPSLHSSGPLGLSHLWQFSSEAATFLHSLGSWGRAPGGKAVANWSSPLYKASKVFLVINRFVRKERA